MSENSEVEDSGSFSSRRFPLKKAPESTEKFPFRDMKYYTNPEDSEVKTKLKTPRFGYVAQLSIHHLESTGRKPELKNVPWLGLRTP